MEAETLALAQGIDFSLWGLFARATLIEQLKIGGIMVIPVGQSDAVQHLIVARKTEEGVDYEELREVRFVPLLEGLGQDG